MFRKDFIAALRAIPGLRVSDRSGDLPPDAYVAQTLYERVCITKDGPDTHLELWATIHISECSWLHESPEAEMQVIYGIIAPGMGNDQFFNVSGEEAVEVWCKDFIQKFTNF